MAHRRELLDQARRTFRFALQDASFGELLVDGDRPKRWDHVFASVQSAGDVIERFGLEYFKHVVVDECHHMPSKSYQEVVPRLRPDILVGLTATPERSDHQSLLPDFDGHIAAELRLWHALDDQLLVPFEYYGISDGVDLRKIRWSRTGYDAGLLGQLYTGHTARADLILAQLARRVGNLRSLRALGFCVSIEHAEFMAKHFTAAGIPARAVHGHSPDRDEASALLRDRTANVLFTCDLYNEGVDLPYVDTLLLLRPTQSSTLFLQQLGRGLRHSPGKSTCLVLDFIGQHRDEFRFDATIAAITGIPRAALRKAVEDGFPYLPSGCSFQLDAVAREAILHSLRSTLAGAKRLMGEIRELTAANGTPTLSTFLEQTGRDLDDVYEAGGWSTLQRSAGVSTLQADEDKEEVDDLSRRLGRLQHVDEPERLRTYRDVLAVALTKPTSLTQRQRSQVMMLESQLNHRGVLRAAEESVAYIAARPTIVRELDELREVLENRVTVAAQVYPVPECVEAHDEPHHVPRLVDRGEPAVAEQLALPRARHDRRRCGRDRGQEPVRYLERHRAGRGRQDRSQVCDLGSTERSLELHTLHRPPGYSMFERSRLGREKRSSRVAASSDVRDSRTGAQPARITAPAPSGTLPRRRSAALRSMRRGSGP